MAYKYDQGYTEEYDDPYYVMGLYDDELDCRRDCMMNDWLCQEMMLFKKHPEKCDGSTSKESIMPSPQPEEPDTMLLPYITYPSIKINGKEPEPWWVNNPNATKVTCSTGDKYEVQII